MTSSPDELSSSSAPSSAAATASIDLGPYRNKNNLGDQVFSAMSADGGLKVTIATICNLLNEMMIQHSMNPIPGGECVQRMIVISY
jgi:molecular chaperone Hsp33